MNKPMKCLIACVVSIPERRAFQFTLEHKKRRSRGADRKRRDKEILKPTSSIFTGSFFLHEKHEIYIKKNQEIRVRELLSFGVIQLQRGL